MFLKQYLIHMVTMLSRDGYNIPCISILEHLTIIKGCVNNLLREDGRKIGEICNSMKLMKMIFFTSVV